MKRKGLSSRTPKQIAAFRKMIAARKRSLSGSGGAMGARRKKRSTSRSVVLVPTRRRYGGSSMGASKINFSNIRRRTGSFVAKSRTIPMLSSALMTITAGVLAGMLTNKIPVKDPRYKAAIPIVSGIVLSYFMGNNKLAARIAEGMVILGGVGLFKQLAPATPFLAGEGGRYYIPAGIPYVPQRAVSSSVNSQPAMMGQMNRNQRRLPATATYYSPIDVPMY